MGRESDSNVRVITDSLSFFVVSDSSSKSSSLLHDALRGDGGGGVTCLTPEKTNDEALSLFRPCFVSRSEKKNNSNKK